MEKEYYIIENHVNNTYLAIGWNDIYFTEEIEEAKRFSSQLESNIMYNALDLDDKSYLIQKIRLYIEKIERIG